MVTASSNLSWTDADTETMFANVGRYLIIFQWIEGKLNQILLLGWGHENWATSQAKLAKMTNFEKVCAIKELVLSSPEFARVHSRPEWCARFELLVARLHEERNRRNSLMHSQYLFEFTKFGLPPLRSFRERCAGEAMFDHQLMTIAEQQNMLSELSQVAMEVNFLHVQLIGDYSSPTVNSL